MSTYDDESIHFFAHIPFMPQASRYRLSNSFLVIELVFLELESKSFLEFLRNHDAIYDFCT